MAPPRIALLVHNRLEDDPRVSRHARAALGAGYRAAVLSVGAPAPGGSRWGATVDGVAVFESRIVRVSALGRVRAAMRCLFAARSSGDLEPNVPPDAGALPPRPIRAVGLKGVLRDVATIGMLIRNNAGVFRQFRGIGAALVHANDLNVLPAGLLLARVWRAPLLYDSHELWTQLDEEWSPLLRRLFALLEGPLLRRADAVVTVNGEIARALAQAYRAPVPVVVMNCPEVPAGRTAAPPVAPAIGAGVRDHSRAGSGDLQVIYQGMLNYRGRGLEGLIDAAATVDGVSLTLRGPGSLGDALARRIADLGARNVRMLPPVPMADLVSALDGYDVGVISYLPSGKNFLFCSPNKLFEYMMAGLAVVCSDLPVLREIVTAADCGLLYEAGNVADLAAALRRLADDPALVARLRANAYRAARERYNAGREEGRLLEIYGRLLAGRAHRSGSPEPGTGSRPQRVAQHHHLVAM